MAENFFQPESDDEMEELGMDEEDLDKVDLSKSVDWTHGLEKFQKIQHKVKTTDMTWKTMDPETQKNFDDALAHMLECGEISGHVDVQCVLGCMYSFGEGVEKDHEKAFMYWKRAAMQDHGEAAFNVGICYRDDKGLPPKATAGIWDFLACNMMNLEEWREEEPGQSDEWALKWFQVAAGQNHTLALLACGSAYYHGHGCYINTEKAAEYYMRAVAKQPDHIELLEKLFHVLDENHDGVITKEEMMNGHEKLNTTEEGAERLFDKLDVDLDGELSLEEFYRKQGYRFDHIAMESTPHAVLKASGNLATLYRFGDGVPKSLQKARALFMEVAANEDGKHRAAKLQADQMIKELTKEIDEECPLVGKRVEVLPMDPRKKGSAPSPMDLLEGHQGIAQDFDFVHKKYLVEFDLVPGQLAKIYPKCLITTEHREGDVKIHTDFFTGHNHITR